MPTFETDEVAAWPVPTADRLVGQLRQHITQGTLKPGMPLRETALAAAFGGPVGFEVAAVLPERVASITVLDTIVQPHTFRKPPPMAPFAVPVMGEVWLGATPRPVFRMLMRRIGLLPGTTVSNAEIDVHHLLLRRGDGGRAFLKIMRSFEANEDKTRLYAGVLAPGRRPVQVLWGRDDPALRAGHHGTLAARAAGLPAPVLLPGRHFLMEDSADMIADAVAALTARSDR